MNDKTFTLKMTTCEYDLINGTSKVDIKSVKDCVIYKDSENESEIWLTTAQVDPEIAPVMITEDRKKIYFLKNWSEGQNNFSITNNILRITTFSNTYSKYSIDSEIKYRKTIFDYLYKNVSNFRDSLNN